MANAQFNNLTYLTRKCLGKVQTAQNIRISAKDDVTKVLSVGVEGYVNSYESNFGEVSFLGKLTLKMLYYSGSDITGATYNADFTDRLTDAVLTQESQLYFDVAIVDVKTETNANTATVTALVETAVYAFVPSETPALIGGDDMFCKSESAEILTGAKTFRLPFAFDSELSATKKIDAVLLAESYVCLQNCKHSVDVLTVSGKCNLRLTYLSDGKLCTDVLPFDFEREIDATAVNADGELKLSAKVRNTKVRLSLDDQGDNSVFTAEIVGTLDGEWQNVEVANLVVDCYGENCDFELMRNKIFTTLPCGAITQSKTNESSLPWESAGEYITTVNLAGIVTNCIAMEGKAVAEGFVRGDVLFKTESGIVSKQLELPFSEALDASFLTGECAPFATVKVMNFAVSTGADFTVKTTLCFDLCSYRNVEYTVVTGAEELPFDKTNLPAIQVCLAHKGETLWSLAKSLHMSEADLVATNPEITSPLAQDANIVVYNKL